MKRILAYGDSNTWGFDPEKFERYAEALRWTGLLQKALSGDALILEEGLCGRTTVFDDESIPSANGLAALPAILEADRPLDAAIIMLGTNDCKSIFSASAEEITAGLGRCLIKTAEVVNPENILLISPLELGEAALRFGYDDRSLAVSRALRQAYQALADRYGTAFLAASEVAKASDIDGQHLTPEGHYALYEAVLNVIDSMF
ncbi:GDSL-type esterase/lipase family protein [Ruminococcus sp.]|uniref:GDSL-type esterase/lipase family protein n=1 Tax=Ruminococcus sp. TaxID=41978 RepID=UPI003890794E